MPISRSLCSSCSWALKMKFSWVVFTLISTREIITQSQLVIILNEHTWYVSVILDHMGMSTSFAEYSLILISYPFSICILGGILYSTLWEPCLSIVSPYFSLHSHKYIEMKRWTYTALDWLYIVFKLCGMRILKI